MSDEGTDIDGNWHMVSYLTKLDFEGSPFWSIQINGQLLPRSLAVSVDMTWVGMKIIYDSESSTQSSILILDT